MHRKLQKRFTHGGAAALMACGIAIGLASGGVRAEPMAQKIDLDHTGVYFAVGHGDFTKVRGQFRLINSVEFVFDRDNVENSSVKAVIEAASLDTNHPYRDNFARSEGFLDVTKHRTITFESTEIKKTGDNTGTVTGNFTMKGVTKPVTLDVVYNKAGKHISGSYEIDGFTVTGQVKRTDFGVNAFVPWVGEMIDVTIEIEAVR